MAGQTNNFYGPVGAAGITNSNVHIDIPRSQLNKELITTASDVTGLLDTIERSQREQRIGSPALVDEIRLAAASHPQLSDPKFIEATIISDPTLKQRVLAASSAASLEMMKVLFPPLAIAIEAVRAFHAPGSISDY
jgi:hypothetical protein